MRETGETCYRRLPSSVRGGDFPLRGNDLPVRDEEFPLGAAGIHHEGAKARREPGISHKCTRIHTNHSCRFV